MLGSRHLLGMGWCSCQMLGMGSVVAMQAGHSYIDGALVQRATPGDADKQGDHCDRSWCCHEEPKFWAACLGLIRVATVCTLSPAQSYCSTTLMLPFMVLCDLVLGVAQLCLLK